MRFTASAAAAILAFAAMHVCDAKPSAGRVDVTSVPEGAQVSVDGRVRGVTPLSLFDIGEGAHLVHVSAPARVPADESVRVQEGAAIRLHYDLAPEKALLLLRTDPSGAEVRSGGATLGTTPLLLTDLDAGRTCQFELALNGYRTKRIDVPLEDRTPVARTEKLELDSGILECSSIPSGAMVSVNGVERGYTPLTVTGVPKGLATVTLRKAGYEPETRELRFVPGEKQSLSLNLKGRPARLTIVSSPEGARAFVDDDYQGKTPVTVTSIAPGQHVLRLEVAGCAPMTRTVYLYNGGESTEEFRLDSVMGRLEVTSTPAGAKVLLDGHAVGTTRKKPGAARSETLLVENVSAGEHSLILRVDGFQENVRKIKVLPQKTLQVNARLKKLFVPDTEIETIHGVFKGVLVSQNDLGVTLEVRPGVEQVFPRADIRRITATDAK